MKNPENELRGQKADAGFDHGFRHLLVDQMAVNRDINRRFPDMQDDGNGRGNCNYDDRHRKQFRHTLSHLINEGLVPEPRLPSLGSPGTGFAVVCYFAL